MLRNSGNNQVVTDAVESEAAQAASSSAQPAIAANDDALEAALRDLKETAALLEQLETEFGPFDTAQSSTAVSSSFANLSRSSSASSLSSTDVLDRDTILDRMKMALTTDAAVEPLILVIDHSEMINAAARPADDRLASRPAERRPSLDASSDDLPEHNDCGISMICLLPYIPAVFNALNEATNDALSLYEANNKSYALLASAAGISFIASLELSGQSTANNLKEIFSIIGSRRRPNGWPALSRPRIISVAIIASGFAAWCALSETGQAYDFSESIRADYQIVNNKHAINLWHIVSATIASGAAITTLLTDSYETTKVMYHLAAGKFSPHANRASACIAPFVTTLCVLGAFTQALQTHSSLKDILKLQSTAAVAGLGSACLINMASTLCFSGGAVLEGVDDLFKYIPQRKFEPSKIAAFLTSLGLALFLSYVMRPLNMGYYQEFANEDLNLPKETTPDYLFETLTWVNFIYQVMFLITSLNPQMVHLFGHIANRIGALLGCLTKPCQPHPASQEDYPAATMADDAFIDTHYNDHAPLLQDQEQDVENARPSQTGLFAASARSASTDELHIPRKKRSSGCPCIVM